MASVVAALSLEQETHLLKLLPEPAQLHLLYKGSHHGFYMHTLRSKIDKEGRFVVIVYFKSGDVKGGYLSKSSDESKDQDAFAFEINHQEVTHFPVLDDSKATHFSTAMSNGCLKFGDCLKLYTENRSICVESWDIMYHQGIWLEPEYLDVELYRVGSARRELPWTEEGRGSLRKNLVSFKPACRSLNRVRVLLMGPAGSGKSSFINSVRSVMFGRVLLLPFIGTATKGFIKKLKSYDIRSERGGKPTALTLCDVLALGDGERTGLTLTDALAVIKGYAPEGHDFQGEAPIKAETPGYRPVPSINDQIHCAVFVLNACQVMTTSDDLTETLRTIQAEIADLDIPQVVLLTHVDQVCHAVQEDVKFVYSSRILQEKMQKAAEVVGLPVSYVLPVKNYSSELSVSCNTDILLLSAIHHILQAVDDTYEENHPPTPADASAEPPSAEFHNKPSNLLIFD
ncbi:interferon-induced protein 44-like [Oncorhynchus nerka]|uniref:interferon-induced protein 44-like n=1 Tax=Oncorhynchus nerka TaxID=8023 RepID=UPI0011305897|nr:interferon-induced protein 44-like isoform X1 [Oncorhynchus nerka]